jgi:hypothetical protein
VNGYEWISRARWRGTSKAAERIKKEVTSDFVRECIHNLAHNGRMVLEKEGDPKEVDYLKRMMDGFHQFVKNALELTNQVRESGRVLSDFDPLKHDLSTIDSKFEVIMNGLRNALGMNKNTVTLDG